MATTAIHPYFTSHLHLLIRERTECGLRSLCGPRCSGECTTARRSVYPLFLTFRVELESRAGFHRERGVDHAPPDAEQAPRPSRSNRPHQLFSRTIRAHNLRGSPFSVARSHDQGSERRRIHCRFPTLACTCSGCAPSISAQSGSCGPATKTTSYPCSELFSAERKNA